MRFALLITFGTLAAFASLALFLALCVLTASDAQGAIVFLIAGPALFALPLMAALATWKFKATSRAAKSVHFSAIGLGLFYASFYVSAPIPGLQVFPAAVVGVVSAGFQAVTGLSPYQWARKPR